MDRQPPVDPEYPPPRVLLLGAAVFYGLLLGGGCLWLWLRERTDLIAEASIGARGLWVGVAAGAGVGLGVTGVLLLASRYLRAFARLESWLGRLIGPLRDVEVMGLAVLSGVIEEFFFRLAMQDAFGLYLSAAVFAVLHSGKWLWTVLAGVLGLAFGWMMQAGLGLVSVSIAHAVINYLGLRRAQDQA